MSSDWGMKISLPGYEAETATPEQCAFHSKYASLKVVLGKDPANFGNYHFQDTITVPVGGTEGIEIFTLAHGYSYIPAHICMAKDNDASPSLTGMMPLIFGVSGFYSYCNNTNFVITFFSAPDGDFTFDINFKYYIFADDGA